MPINTKLEEFTSSHVGLVPPASVRLKAVKLESSKSARIWGKQLRNKFPGRLLRVHGGQKRTPFPNPGTVFHHTSITGTWWGQSLAGQEGWSCSQQDN